VSKIAIIPIGDPDGNDHGNEYGPPGLLRLAVASPRPGSV
jgi:hypothetical protein